MKFWNWKNPKIKDSVSKSEVESELYLCGTISEESWFDDDVTPEMFQDELNQHPGNITLWINSGGGDVFAANQIYNMLKNHKGNITVKIDAIAASAATVVAMAGDKVQISPVGMFMIHNPSTVAFGNHLDMQKAIDLLGEVKENIINAYQTKTKLSHNRISQLMDDETWMNAKKALELGFIDEILYNEKEDTSEKDEDTEESVEKEEEDKKDSKMKNDGRKISELVSNLYKQKYIK